MNSKFEIRRIGDWSFIQQMTSDDDTNEKSVIIDYEDWVKILDILEDLYDHYIAEKRKNGKRKTVSFDNVKKMFKIANKIKCIPDITD